MKATYLKHTVDNEFSNDSAVNAEVNFYPHINDTVRKLVRNSNGDVVESESIWVCFDKEFTSNFIAVNEKLRFTHPNLYKKECRRNIGFHGQYWRLSRRIIKGFASIESLNNYISVISDYRNLLEIEKNIHNIERRISATSNFSNSYDDFCHSDNHSKISSAVKFTIADVDNVKNFIIWEDPIIVIKYVDLEDLGEKYVETSLNDNNIFMVDTYRPGNYSDLRKDSGSIINDNIQERSDESEPLIAHEEVIHKDVSDFLSNR